MFGEEESNAGRGGGGRDHDLGARNQKQTKQLGSQDDKAESIPSADISKGIETMPGHIASVLRIDARKYDIQIFEGRLEPLQLDPMPSSRGDRKYSFAQLKTLVGSRRMSESGM